MASHCQGYDNGGKASVLSMLFSIKVKWSQRSTVSTYPTSKYLHATSSDIFFVGCSVITAVG
jgi:hypothetical protein